MLRVRAGMGIGILLMLILASLLIALSSSKVGAQTACQTELEALESAITSAAFTNPEKDQQNLLAKLQNAETKLGEGKTQDAIAKITDIRSTVARLAAGGKLDQDGANAIDAAAATATSCLGGTTSV